jgi:hypothetical protein
VDQAKRRRVHAAALAGEHISLAHARCGSRADSGWRRLQRGSHGQPPLLQLGGRLQLHHERRHHAELRRRPRDPRGNGDFEFSRESVGPEILTAATQRRVDEQLGVAQVQR